MILEGLVTTQNAQGGMHVAPMGPWVDEALSTWELRPFQTSATFANLHRTQHCVFHVTDNAWMLAKAVLGQADDFPFAKMQEGSMVLDDCCSWVALRITHWDLSQPRAIATAEVIERREVRPFFGWNRAKHAVLEAAILASRVSQLDVDFLASEMERLQIIVNKTAGQSEQQAFMLLSEHIHRATHPETPFPESC